MKKALRTQMLVAGWLILLMLPGRPGWAQQRVGLFASLRGQVEARLKGEPAWRPAVLRDDVFFEDLVRTSERSRARILLEDDSILNVSPNAQVEIEEFVLDRASDVRRATINISSGIVRVLVGRKFTGRDSTFTITTPTAKIGVRGTTIFVHVVSPTLTIIAILFDDAVVSNVAKGVTGTVRLVPGLKTLVRAGEGPSAPEPFSLDELRQLQAEAGLGIQMAVKEKEKAAESKSKATAVVTTVASDDTPSGDGVLSVSDVQLVSADEIIQAQRDDPSVLIFLAELFTGTFVGTFDFGPSDMGSWTGVFTQSGTSLTGTYSESGAPGETWTLTATISGNSFTGSGISNLGTVDTISGTLSGRTISGNITEITPSPDDGTYEGTKQ